MVANTNLPMKMPINVSVDYQPVLLDRDVINRLCIVGDSDNTRGTNYGTYSSLAGVSEHYGDDTSEYEIAARLFSQVPRPKSVTIATVADIEYPV